MFVQRHRVAVAGIVAAAVVAVPAAALAAGSGSPTAKPSPPRATASASAEPSKPAPPPTQPGPVSSQEAAAMASKSAAAASQPNGNGLAAVSALAARLGVSADLAGRAYKQIMALTGQGGRLDTTSAAFAGIARQLGVTPAQLAVAWNAVS